VETPAPATATEATKPVLAAGPAAATAPPAPRATPAGERLPAASFARLVLLGVAGVWGAVGVWALVDTPGAADAVDYRLETNLARFEFRAMYGGMALAMALVHTVMAARRGWLGPGLALAGATLLGLASGRVYSMAIEGAPGLTGLLLLAMELLMGGAVGVAGYRLGMASRC
jgi:hypothetical protein